MLDKVKRIGLILIPAVFDILAVLAVSTGVLTPELISQFWLTVILILGVLLNGGAGVGLHREYLLRKGNS